MLRKLWNQASFRYSLLSALIWGLAAHAYAFFHDFFSHDALNAMVATPVEEHWKIELGRFLFPLYRTIIRNSLALPWIIGLFTILWAALALYLLSRIFRLKSFASIFFAGGILLINRTVICLAATYIYELDIDMLSILFAVLAVYLWRCRRWGFLWGAIPVALCLGIYQCNLSAVVTLIIFSCVLSLVQEGGQNNQTDGAGTLKRNHHDGTGAFQRILIRGLLSLVMIALGLALYYLLLRIVLSITGIQLVTNTYNSITNAFLPKNHGFFSLIIGTYRNFFNTLFPAQTSYPRIIITVLTALILLGTLWLLAQNCFKNRPSAACLVLAAVLLLILPLGANTAYILNDGQTHDLMKYAVWMFFLFPVILAENTKAPGKKKTPVRKAFLPQALYALLFVLLMDNILTANSLYLKKNLEQHATLSVMTRVFDDIQKTEGYVSGETPLCFIGVPTLGGQMPGFGTYYNFTGNWSQNAIDADTYLYYYHTYAAYTRYYLNQPVTFCTIEQYNALKGDPLISAAPLWPAQGSIFWQDGVLVIHLS